MFLRRLFGKALSTIGLALVSAVLPAQDVVRGPYLQLATPTSVVVRWRTESSVDAIVHYGTAVDALNRRARVSAVNRDHNVRLNDLLPGTRYFYAVGSSDRILAGEEDESFSFVTPPLAGSTQATRIWVIGDSGTKDASARAVRDAYKAFSETKAADLWIMLGDNAYNEGTDEEYQAAVFDMYPELLRQTPLWPTPGNHDVRLSSDTQTQTGPYFDIFTLPDNAQAGGVASGTEAYYSFDYANIHFVSLESYDLDRSTDGAMLTWLENDLAANRQAWTIAYWHHPPYSKGSHDSDGELNLIEMRENAVPILEAYGVDIVLSGHSHSYERSYLLNGHYGRSDSLTTAMLLNDGDGRDGGDGRYQKSIGAVNGGAVYVVAGSSGTNSGGLSEHPAMYTQYNVLGSVVLDVSDTRLDAQFIDASGAVLDDFTLQKGVDTTPPRLLSARSEDATHVLLAYSEPLDESTAVDYSLYTVDGGISVTGAQLQGVDQVRLTTSRLSIGQRYEVATAPGVQDRSGNATLDAQIAAFDFSPLVTVTFQDGVSPDAGYAGTRDADIASGAATQNFGESSLLELDGSGDRGEVWSLLGFDLSAVPIDAVVDSARLVLNVTNRSAGSYFMYGVNRAWSESAVTWTQTGLSGAWSSPGAKGAPGDRGAGVLGTLRATTRGRNVIDLNASGVALVQDWINNPESNHGFLMGDTETADGVDVSSSESPDAPPSLEISYRASAADGVVSSVLPSSRSVEVGVGATFFATILNSGATAGQECAIAPASAVPAAFFYQETDPNTNAPVGAPNTPVDIAAGALTTMVFSFSPASAFAPREIELVFDCANTVRAPVVTGLNTVLLSASETPTPDIIALAATINGDGIVTASPSGVFSVATVNVGARGALEVSADFGDATLPVALSVCETDPVTAACVNPVTPSSAPVIVDVASGAAPTFGIFVDSSGPIPFDPGANRLFLRFKDTTGATRGSTSVAVTSP